MKITVILTDERGRRFQGTVDLVPAEGSEKESSSARAKNRAPGPSLSSFDLNPRAFMKKHATRMQGDRKFTLLLARLAKGATSKQVPLDEIQSHWNTMKSVMGGKFNPAYAIRAKEHGWVDSPKRGNLCLVAHLEGDSRGLMSKQAVADYLKAFPPKHVDSLLTHFTKAVDKFGRGGWEEAIGKAGMFVEAVLKALWASTGNAVPGGRMFKSDTIINDLGKLPFGSQHDSVRLAIPRACRFVYEIASNRGGRHDPDEVDPNEMDAITAVEVCSWIIAEMIRISAAGKVDLVEAKRVVSSLVEKKYPLVERVGGRTYFHGGKKSALDVMLLALADNYPRRISRMDLISTALRHGFETDNARKAADRITRFVDDDGSGRFRLLAPGLAKAEQIWVRIASGEPVSRLRKSRRRRKSGKGEITPQTRESR